MSMSEEQMKQFWEAVVGDGPRYWYENLNHATMESFFSDMSLAISATYNRLRHDQEYLARMCYARYTQDVAEPYPWESFYQRVRIETDKALDYFNEHGFEHFTLKLFDVQLSAIGIVLYGDKWYEDSNKYRFLSLATFVGYVYAATFELVERSTHGNNS